MENTIAKEWKKLNKAKAAFAKKIDGASAKQLSFKPTPEHWNTLEVIEHLLIVEEGILSFFKRYPPLQSTRIPTFSQKVKSWMINYVYKLPAIKVKAPVKSIEPKGGLSFAYLEEAWKNAHSALEDIANEQPKDRLKYSVFKHPVSGGMTMQQTIKFIGSHIDNHRHQVDRIQKEAHYPK